MRTLKQLAKEAINVQNACNLCGVAQAFARAMVDLGEHTNGTDERNQHPISILWADKIAHLTGTQSLGHSRVMSAYTAAYKLVDSCEHCGEIDCSSATCWSTK